MSSEWEPECLSGPSGRKVPEDEAAHPEGLCLGPGCKNVRGVSDVSAASFYLEQLLVECIALHCFTLPVADPRFGVVNSQA